MHIEGQEFSHHFQSKKMDTENWCEREIICVMKHDKNTGTP